jgi:hypothetical protein
MKKLAKSRGDRSEFQLEKPERILMSCNFGDYIFNLQNYKSFNSTSENISL